MANGMLTEQQMEQLLSMSGEDFDAEAQTFAGKLPAREAYELRAAIQSNDMGRINEIVRNAPSSVDPKDMQKMQAAVQKNEFVTKMVEVNRVHTQLSKKKTEGTELTTAEEKFLSQAEQIEAGNKKLEEYYPKAFGKDGAEQGKENASDKNKGEFGFAGDWQFEDPKKMDWLPIFDKTIFDPLKQFKGEKDIGDLVINVGVSLLVNMPMGFVAETLNQKRSNMKESDKKAKEGRESAIDSNLKNRGLSRNDLASQLAHEAKDWILNDPKYKNLPEKGPHNDYQKALIEKRDFAASLPKKENGDLDFGKMTSKQQKKYAQYVSIYSQSPKWRGYMCEMCGVKIKPDEYKKQAKTAAQMIVAQKVAEEKVAGGLEVPSTPKMPDLSASQTPVSHASASVASRNYATTEQAPSGPAPRGPATTGRSPSSPSSPSSPAPRGPAPRDPASSIHAPTSPAPRGPAPSMQTPTGATPSVQTSTGQEQTSSASSLAVPKVSKEAKKAEQARQVIEEVHTNPELAGVTVKGTPKNPVIINEDGTKVPYTPETLNEAKKKVDKVKREKTANDEAMANANQKVQALTNARNGTEKQGASPSITRTNTGAGRS